MHLRRLGMALVVGAVACSSSGPQIGSICASDLADDPCFQTGLACTPDYTDTSPTGAYCELPGETFPCLPKVGCISADLTCVGSGSDGGICLATCTTSEDCWDPMTACLESNGARTCQPNPCSSPWKPCAASPDLHPDGGDGTCILLTTLKGFSTACLQGGTATDAGCGYYRGGGGGGGGLCAPGLTCETSITGRDAGRCAPICDAFEGAGGDGGPTCAEACVFASPPPPPPPISALDIISSRLGGCVESCIGDGGCPANLECVGTNEAGSSAAACLLP